MKQEITAEKQRQSIQVNRYAYILYLILVIYLLFKGDLEWAVVNLGIAMVFDPFDPRVMWQHRPFYQKALLITHLALTFAGFLYLLLR